MISALRFVAGLFAVALLGEGAFAFDWQAQEQGDFFAEARRYEQAGDLKNAEKAYAQHLQRYPGSAQAHANLGVVYAHEARFERAVEEYRTALKLDPSLRGVYLNLGIAYFQQSRFESATAPLEKFLSVERASVQAQTLLGLCYTQLGRYDEAVRLLAPLRSSSDPAVLFNL